MVSTTESWWRTDARVWNANGWSLELRGDELAEITHGGRMLLRGVRAAVRDRGWLTVPVRIEGVESGPDRLTLTLRHEGLGALLSSTLTVTADDESLTITWDARNATDFDTCRVGLVALHPASQAGTAVTVVHDDGSSERTAFPSAISPHQPIRDIRELRVDDGPTLVFTGDVFEMEDQRNWTDASFKTYSRPLDLPYPYLLPGGERVVQSITVRPAADAARPESAAPSADADPVIELAEHGPFPAIGVEASTVPSPVPPSPIGAFRVVELNLTTPTWRAALERAAADGLPLDVRLVTDGDPRILASAVGALRELDVLRVTPFDAVLHVSDGPTVRALRAALADTGVDLPLVAGARSHFTELNREQERIPRDVAGIAVTTTPLFHTLDTEQLVEALPMQRLVATQSVRLAAGLPVHIGPVSLRPRFNNVATTPEPAPARADLAEGYGAEFTGGADERQRSPELAAWVIASAAASAVPGVASLSWFETSGPRGVEGTPAAAAVTTLASMAGATLFGGLSPDGLVWALGARRDRNDTVLVANLDRRPRRVTVRMPRHDPLVIDLGPGSWERIEVGED